MYVKIWSDDVIMYVLYTDDFGERIREICGIYGDVSVRFCSLIEKDLDGVF